MGILQMIQYLLLSIIVCLYMRCFIGAVAHHFFFDVHILYLYNTPVASQDISVSGL